MDVVEARVVETEHPGSERMAERETEEGEGKLYVVSTPIGNLKDITLRALEVLSEVDLIAAEDTRRTRVLLEHYGIRTPTTSYHDFNKEKRLPALLARLHAGQRVAVVSDAGTPGISDPAFRLGARVSRGTGGG